MQVSPNRYKLYVKCKLHILAIIIVFLYCTFRRFPPPPAPPKMFTAKANVFYLEILLWAWNTVWLSTLKYHNDTVCIAGKSRYKRVGWDCIGKCKHSQSTLRWTMLLLFDDYDNLIFKTEVHYVSILKLLSISWKETLQINLTCMLQPFGNIASKFKYTG